MGVNTKCTVPPFRSPVFLSVVRIGVKGLDLGTALWTRKVPAYENGQDGDGTSSQPCALQSCRLEAACRGCTNRGDGELFCAGGDGKLGLGSSDVYSTRCLNWLANIPISYAHRPNILLY